MVSFSRHALQEPAVLDVAFRAHVALWQMNGVANRSPNPASLKITHYSVILGVLECHESPCHVIKLKAVVFEPWKWWECFYNHPDLSVTNDLFSPYKMSENQMYMKYCQHQVITMTEKVITKNRPKILMFQSLQECAKSQSKDLKQVQLNPVNST